MLKSLNSPKGSAHYNIGNRMKYTFTTENQDLLIKQENSEKYVVYNGHAGNLKARAREHDRGHEKTACLALRQYKELHDYEWYFCYLAVSSLDDNYQNDKILRKAVEQGWRTKYGWPILCKG